MSAMPLRDERGAGASPAPAPAGAPAAVRRSGAFGAIFRFETGYHLRQPLFWIVFAVFGLMAFGASASDAVQIGGAIGNVHRNAPVVIVQLLGVLSILGIFVVTAFVASAVLRDHELGTAELFFSKPIRRRDYLLGRFAGSLLVSLLVFLGPALGILLASKMPWIDPQRLGPFQPWAYGFALVVVVLPNLFFIAALLFALATLTRSMLGTYLGVVAFLVAYFVATAMNSDVQRLPTAALLDPFGLTAVDLVTRYWTVVERNAVVPAVAGTLLWNRLFALALGAILLAVTWALFRSSREGLRLRRAKALAPEATAPARAVGGVAIPRPARRFDAATHRRQLLHGIRSEVAGVLRSVPFLVLLAVGTINVLGGSQFLDEMFGTKVYPVTGLMLRLLAGNFFFLLIVIVTFYSGELVWRERSRRLAEVHDAMPVPNWVPLVSKLVALWAVVLAFEAVGVLTTVGVQLWRGYHHFEPGVYLSGSLLVATGFALGSVLAVFLQVVANNKFVGYLLMILWLISAIVLNALDFEHRLYQYGSMPDRPYSDMNGWGHHLQAWGWFALYWTLFAAGLAVLSHLFWVRGTGHTGRERLRLAALRATPRVRVVLGALAVAWLATGGWIFWNTNVLNAYRPGDVVDRAQADYEKKYRHWLREPIPRVVDFRADVDLFPHERRADIRGTYRIVNRNPAPLAVVPMTLNPRVTVRSLDFRAGGAPAAAKLESNDADLGFRVYRLAQPLAPGASMELAFDLAVVNRGFENNGSDDHFVWNGTFFNNREYLPVFGYDDQRQLVDRSKRRKYDLGPVPRAAKRDDASEYANTYLGRDADWITFATTVSTSPDQIAIAPGYLEKEWTANGRRYFRYTMDAPILDFTSWLSARYAVARDHWNGPPGSSPDPNGVAIEVDYHPEHAYNVPRMIDGVKKSLDYFTKNFSPYQHRQVRIVEFPRYERFAQSFPNTIPFSESIGFIADLRDKDDIDYVFYVTAHEVAHQWWGHQLIGANVQGATSLSETLAQYSALMVMEKEYGREQMRKFLKYELDSYLRNRGGELVEEEPLALVEDQGYIHYRKGSLVMYAVRDAIGEQAVNRALARILREHAFHGPPFPTSRVLVDALRAEAPADQQGFLTDLFERITLFENEAKAASAHRRADGKWVVDLELAAKKVYADGQGRETPAPLDQTIDVGVFGPKPKEKGKPQPVLYLAKHRFTAPPAGTTSKLEIVVDSEPYEAGIDPMNKLVDRNSDDNRRRVDVER